MSTIRRILDDIRDTDAVANKLRNAADATPHDEVLKINAESVAKRRSDLVRRLDQFLKNEQHDVVGYSIKRGVERYPAAAVAKSVLSFQEMFTAIFDALRNTPKIRYRPSKESVDLSTMDFATAGQGSVVVSLHIPNDRLLLVESDLDRTFARLFQLLATRRQDDFRELVAIVGIASITKTFAWAQVSAESGFDTSITWGKSYDDRKLLNIAHIEAISIRDAIDATSEESERRVEYDCILEGIDPTTSYFHIVLSDGTDIKGETDDLFLNIPWTTKRPYRAELVCRSVIKFATGESKETWKLIKLTQIDHFA